MKSWSETDVTRNPQEKLDPFSSGFTGWCFIMLYSICLLFILVSTYIYIYVCFVGKDKKGPSTSCRFQGIVLSAHVPLRYLRPSLTRQWPRMAPHALHATPSRQLPHLAPLSYSPCPMPPDHGSWWCFGETLETPCLIWMLYHIYTIGSMYGSITYFYHKINQM